MLNTFRLEGKNYLMQAVTHEARVLPFRVSQISSGAPRVMFSLECNNAYYLNAAPFQ